MPKLFGKSKVIFSRLEIQAFKSVMPCSNLRDRSYWFEFDSNGDLVDTDVPQQDDGYEATALSRDAQAWMEGKKVDWLHND